MEIIPSKWKTWFSYPQQVLTYRLYSAYHNLSTVEGTVDLKLYLESIGKENL